MKAISVLAYDRPEMLEQCLDAIHSCRNRHEYHVVVSIDGGGDPKCAEIAQKFKFSSIMQPKNWGIDNHNIQVFRSLFGSGTRYLIALEDDAILTPDALELADWYYHDLECRDEFLLMSLGDPLYRKQVEDREKVVDLGLKIYTSAFSFTKEAFGKFNTKWNYPLRTQVGWDWSLSFLAYTNCWRLLGPEVSRARNIGRVGVHSYAEWFDQNVANAAYSDGSTVSNYKLHDPNPPDWVDNELQARRGPNGT